MPTRTFKQHLARLLRPRDDSAERRILACFRSGMDTKAIADLIGEPEARIANMLSQTREDERALS